MKQVYGSVSAFWNNVGAHYGEGLWTLGLVLRSRNLQILQVAPATNALHIERSLTCGALGEGEREGILQYTGGVYCDGVMFLEVVIVVLKANFCVRISSTVCA